MSDLCTVQVIVLFNVSNPTITSAIFCLYYFYNSSRLLFPDLFVAAFTKLLMHD